MTGGIPDAWGSPAYAMTLTLLGGAEGLHERYERTGHLPDLDEAIDVFATVHRHAHNVDLRSAAANGLGTSLWSRYERFSRAADLDSAVGLFREALAMYPDGGSPLAPSFRANLGSVLHLRWLRTRSDDDLAEALAALRAALADTPPSSSRRIGRLTGLAAVLAAVHVQHEDSSALAEAIDTYRAALRGAGPGEDTIPTRSDLAEALRQWFRSTGDRAALDEAVEHARATLTATDRKHPLHPRFESNLAIILADRFTARSRPRDLEEAFTLARKACAATPADHPNRLERLLTLSGIQRMHLLHVSRLRLDDPRRQDDVVGAATGNRPRKRRLTLAQRRALRRLIHTSQEAAAVAPPGHVVEADAHIAAGAALTFKGITDKDNSALVRALSGYRWVATTSAAPPKARVTAAWQWAIMQLVLSGGSDWAGAMPPFELAVSLLPRTAPPRITHADRERRLAGFAGLARDAAACAISLGDPERALRLLEHGRGVLLARTLDARTDLTALREHHPDLADRFERLRSILDGPEDFGFTARPASETLSGESRHAMADEWEALVERIHQLPGFADFLRSPQVSDLLTAVPGPVVVVNVSVLRCDALLITDGAVRALPLPLMGEPELRRRADEFRAATRAVVHNGPEAHATIGATLAWLWRAVASPVLAALDLRRPGETPRLWWVPTGPLTGLPLHAAGTDDESVLDQVISSYAPTVRGLVAAPESGHPRRPTPLVVSVPAAPGLPALPHVRAETAALTSRFPQHRLLADEQAVRQAVLDALPTHSWVHFACHAVGADGVGAGRLFLHDHASAPLTVADLARLHLRHADVAFLSACETGIGREELDDEALHIAGACRMAGFRHVVGTLWEVRDKLAKEVTAAFYSEIEAAGWDTGQIARALHEAVRQRRAQHPTTPVLWAQYVHVGP